MNNDNNKFRLWKHDEFNVGGRRGRQVEVVWILQQTRGGGLGEACGPHHEGDDDDDDDDGDEMMTVMTMMMMMMMMVLIVVMR